MSNRVPPQIKKRRHIVADASFLEEAFSAKPDDYEAAWEALKAQYDKDTKPQARLQTVILLHSQINMKLTYITCTQLIGDKRRNEHVWVFGRPGS